MIMEKKENIKLQNNSLCSLFETAERLCQNHTSKSMNFHMLEVTRSNSCQNSLLLTHLF